METKPTVDKLLYSVRETAEMLGISERKLFSETVPTGQLRCVKIGNRKQYELPDIQAWIQSKKQTSNTSVKGIK